MNFSFADDHLKDETRAVEDLLGALTWDSSRAKRVENMTALLIEKMQGRKAGASEIENFLTHFPLQSAEGLAMMTLAEALLRIPDTETKDALIEEKLNSADWSKREHSDFFFKMMGGGLSLARKTLGSFLGGIGKPVIRKSLEEAVKRIGAQFVVGETIETALKKGRDLEVQGYRLSYDMLGEGARTAEDAERYFKTYLNSLHAIGRSSNGSAHERSGMSVKLSALHPRYVWMQEKQCVPALTAKLLELCRAAAQYNMGITVDAEEADRLELSLEIIQAVSGHPDLKNWNGFGLAVQAYDKRCFKLIDDLYEMAKKDNRHLQVRLVKGAYWDSEIKRAQSAGLENYPLYTRKKNTDVSYLACAQKLLSYRDAIYPMFATHNAQSVAGVLDLAGDNRGGFEFQRLFGMGESLGQVMTDSKIAPVCIYAPVGSYEDLLPYLVRRMLENGANTSFIKNLRASQNDSHALAEDFIIKLTTRSSHAHAKIVLPRDLYGDRLNSLGFDFAASAVRNDFKNVRPRTFSVSSLPAVPVLKNQTAVRIPYPGSIAEQSGPVWEIVPQQIESAFRTAETGFTEWRSTKIAHRAEILRRVADALEKNRQDLIGILRSEGGRSLQDALSEIREAADFCRYYALQGERLFKEQGEALKGPTGESNILHLLPRGIFICISPWNFPLAIFTGQIVAALMAGNAVMAKPAEQTPVIAYRAVELMYQCGVPRAALSLILGDGKIGSMLVGDKRVAGVAFTGSAEVARSINRTLANKEGEIVPLIAETGGQNAMIVDSSALLEQVVDDVIVSAFGSTGQRCSALRVLYVQEEVMERFSQLLKGAMAELQVGDARDDSTDIGPVIDAQALRALETHQEYLKSFAKEIGRTPKPAHLKGYYFAPIAYEIDSIKRLRQEVFGPVLHVIRYKSKNRAGVIEEINATGYGLTFGLHSRLQSRFESVVDDVAAGNIYINRSMIGAVVGVQPFGGSGLSGTGPKAGGPHYLTRFAHEKTITINTTAIGGNIGLISMEGE